MGLWGEALQTREFPFPRDVITTGKIGFSSKACDSVNRKKPTLLGTISRKRKSSSWWRVTSSPSSTRQPWKRRMTVNSQASQGKQKVGLGYKGLFWLIFPDFTFCGKFSCCLLSSTWPQYFVSRNGAHLITHLNATQLFLQTEGTLFPKISIWLPARLLSNTL